MANSPSIDISGILRVEGSPGTSTTTIEGVTRLDRLVLTDQTTGKEWEISIHDGKIITEPFEKIEKRDYRIDQIID
jgi:hypothetical protein